jgi:chromosome segregation ATPase
LLRIIKGSLEAIENEMKELKEVHHAQMMNRWKALLKSSRAELKAEKAGLRDIKKEITKCNKKPGPFLESLKEKEDRIERTIEMLERTINRQEATITNHKTFYSPSFYRKLPVWVMAPQSDFEPILMDWNLLQKVAKLLKNCRVELEIYRKRNLLIIHYYTGYSKGKYELQALEGDCENFKLISTAEPIQY